MNTTRIMPCISHGRSLVQLVASPGQFFENRRQGLDPVTSGGFLVVSAVLFTTATLVYHQNQANWISGAILMGNAVGMVLILSLVSYIVMVLSVGKKTGFRQVFSVYAYASGTSLVAAWVPHLLIFTELWRWVLVGIGLTRGCGLKWKTSSWVIVCSIIVMTILLRSILPLLQA